MKVFRKWIIKVDGTKFQKQKLKWTSNFDLGPILGGRFGRLLNLGNCRGAGRFFKLVGRIFHIHGVQVNKFYFSWTSGLKVKKWKFYKNLEGRILHVFIRSGTPVNYLLNFKNKTFCIAFNSFILQFYSCFHLFQSMMQRTDEKKIKIKPIRCASKNWSFLTFLANMAAYGCKFSCPLGMWYRV